MSFNNTKSRFYATLLALGSCILLYRVFILISGGFLTMMTGWVAALLIIEMVVDLGCLVYSLKWWLRHDTRRAQKVLRLAALAALIHALRVYIFVLGRLGPVVDFDVRPDYRIMYQNTWTWEGVYFAAIMATLGVIGVVVIWRIRAPQHKTQGT